MWPDERIVGLIEKEFEPVRVHVRDQASEFQRLGRQYGAQWTPASLVLNADGVERHRVEGFLPADDMLAQLKLGLAHAAFGEGDWAAAERRFQTVAEEHPETDMAAEATYWAGVSRYKGTGDPGALAGTAKRLKERYDGSSWSKKASVWG